MTVTLYAPDNCGGFSCAGVAYEVNDGSIEVPDEAVADAVAHGFTLTLALSDAETAAVIQEATEQAVERKKRGRPAKVQTEVQTEVQA